MGRAMDGVTKEFVGAPLGDPRRQERLLLLAQRMSAKPDSSFPKAMSSAELEGAYRFFGNSKVTAEAILAPHVRETLGRVQQDPVTLVVHDSSTLSFNSEGFREGLVQPRSNPCASRSRWRPSCPPCRSFRSKRRWRFATPRSEPGWRPLAALSVLTTSSWWRTLGRSVSLW